MIENKKKRIWMVGVGLVSLSFLFFQFFYPYHLFFQEQIRLFLFTPDYFYSYFTKPSWFTCYAGDFLTQFFYLRGGGATILTAVFLLEWQLISVIFKKIKISNPAFWSLLPVGTDLILHLGLLHTLSVSIGLITILLLFIAYTTITNKWLSSLSAIGISLAGYWLAGSLVFVFPFLVISHDYKNQQLNWLKWILISVVTFVSPVVFQTNFLLTYNQLYLFPAIETESILVQISLGLTLLASLSVQQLKTKFSKLIPNAILLIFASIMVIGLTGNANFNFEKILSLDSETYFGNTDRVLELSKKYKLQNKYAAYFTNMALAKKGLLPDSLLHSYQPASLGLVLPVSPDENWQSIFFSNEVFFLAGDMNLAQHSAMLGNTFSPYNRSSRMMKRLAEINLINGDQPGANKYLRLLEKTLFHRKWAMARQQINRENQLANWLAAKQMQLATSDTIRQSNDYIASFNYLVAQQPGNVIALDYLLCYHLLNKDLRSFRKLYEQYGRAINRPVPEVYAEALLIQLFAGKATQDEVLAYSIPPKKMNEFMAYTKQYGQNKERLEILSSQFGQSYWYYYHFATIKNNGK